MEHNELNERLDKNVNELIKRITTNVFLRSIESDALMTERRDVLKRGNRLIDKDGKEYEIMEVDKESDECMLRRQDGEEFVLDIAEVMCMLDEDTMNKMRLTTGQAKKGAKEKIGLIKDKNSECLDKKTRKTLDVIGKVIGYKIVVDSMLEGQNCIWDNVTKTIRIFPQSDRRQTLSGVFGREMTHSMKSTNPKAYKKMVYLVSNYIGESIFNYIIDRMGEFSYVQENEISEFSKDVMVEFFVSDLLSVAMKDEEFVDLLLLNIDPSLRGKFVRNMLRTIRDTYYYVMDEPAAQHELGCIELHPMRVKKLLEELYGK